MCFVNPLMLTARMLTSYYLYPEQYLCCSVINGGGTKGDGRFEGIAGEFEGAMEVECQTYTGLHFKYFICTSVILYIL
jgi:hypothetical protein